MNQQLFDDSTLIRIFALHELHNLKDRGLTRGRFSIITAAINSSFWHILSRSTANLARLWLIFTGGKVWMTITTSTANA